MLSSRVRSLMLFVALLLAPSCHQLPTAADQRTVVSMTMRVVGGSAMSVGETTPLVVTLLDSMRNVVTGRKISFNSSDSTVATVSATGIVTARAVGLISVSSHSGNLSAMATLSVAAAPPPFVTVEVGGSNSCAMTAAQSLFCWRNAIGPGVGSSQGTPQLVATPTPFQSITVGNEYQCGLAATGEAYCWGDNSTNQLGTGDTISYSTPTLVAGGLRFTSISAGWRSTCGVATNATAYCWGFNASGQLGNGTLSSSAVPVPVSGGMHFLSVSVGDAFACGLTSQGAFCWGDNHIGELGHGDTVSTTTPVAVSGGLTVTAISADAGHACALTRSGAAYCWGSNAGGELGIGFGNGVTQSAMPVPVAGNLTWRAITVGNITCGIATTGITYCWGNNLYDLLASGTLTPFSAVPAIAWGGRSFSIVRAHGTADHACALGADSFVYCWGAYVS